MINRTHKDWPAGPSLAGWMISGPMQVILEILQRHLIANLGDVKLGRKLTRIIAKMSKEAWLQGQHNLNLQIREFVLSCPRRRAFVRSVIGEGAIKRWELRYENRFTRPASISAKAAPKPRKTPKSYEWKPYVLPEVLSIYKSMRFGFSAYPKSTPFPDTARSKRGFQPTIFWPHQLHPNYQHVRKAPDPKTVEMVRKSDNLCARFHKKAGWTPQAKTSAQDARPNPQPIAEDKPP